MSHTEKKETNLIINKLTKEQFKNITDSDINNEVYHIIDDAHYTELEIQTLLNTKQNTLTSENAGNGINIENGIISNTQISAEWGNIQGDINHQHDLIDKLNVQNMYITNSISTDNTGYSQLKGMYHSTFDKSKVTIVGSPVITNDGLASGFSVNDYIKGGLFDLTSISTFRIDVKFIVSENKSTNEHKSVFHLYNSNNPNAFKFIEVDNSKLYRLYVPTSTTTSSAIYISTIESGSHTASFSYNGSILSVYIDDELKLTQVVQKDFIHGNYALYIGTSGNDDFVQYFTGSIDLKNTSITINGIPTFNANETGIDVIKDIRIPYTKSNTGSKIVDVAYRDRVQHIYKQFGQSDYYTIDEENKNFTLPMGEIYGMMVDKSLSNLTENGEKHFLNKTQITNCILSIEELVKVEPLASGRLELKAGSVVYVSTNGTFNEVTISSNVSAGSTGLFTQAGARELFCCYVPSKNELVNIPVNETYTQNIAPTTFLVNLYGGWYDTANNIMKYTYDGGVTWTVCSLPFAMGTPSTISAGGTGWVGNIKHIFNGYGYVGQYTFTTRGLKYLISNGRNADKTLNNIEVTTTNLTLTSSIGLSSWIGFLRQSGELITYGVSYYFEQEEAPTNLTNNFAMWLNTDENIMYKTSDKGVTWEVTTQAYFGDLRKPTSNGNITEIKPNKPVELVKKDDLSIIINNINNNIKNTLNKTQITNCLLEVPQNIKLELKDGVLTLKTGSKVIVPNGSNKFDEVTISADKTRTWTYTRQGMMFYRYDTNVLHPVPLSQIYSGTTAPAGTLPSPTCWYDTTNNKVKITSDGGTTWIDTYSFPLCLLTANGTQITSIDQVFNGFGYIGSIIWCDKGVKCLLPNGRNADGTLNNFEVVTNNVLVGDSYNTGNKNIECRLNRNENGTLSLARNTIQAGYGYDEEKNVYYRPDGLMPNSICIAKVATSTTTIETFEAIRVFHAVGYEELKEITSNLEQKVSNKTQITNCLLEVPEKIKYTLLNGVLTLKAGSVITFPNGVGVFEEYTLTEDKTFTYTGSTTNKAGVFFVGKDAKNLSLQQLALCTSGTTPPTGTGVFYNTNDNKINFYSSGTKGAQFSFPICLCTFGTEVGGIASIDEVFNGFGFIGHHTFSYDGIKSLIPNGKNPDGTLKNIETITTSINVRDEANRGSWLCFWDGTNLITFGINSYFEQDIKPTFSGQYCMWLNTKENILYSTSDSGATWVAQPRMYLGVLRKNSSSGDFVEASFKTPVELVKKAEFNKNIIEINSSINTINSNISTINSNISITNSNVNTINSKVSSYPKIYVFKGKLLNASGDTTVGYGTATIFLYSNGRVEVQFALQITTAGTASDVYTWGINRDFLKNAGIGIPEITPTDGGAVTYFKANDGTIDSSHQGYGGMLSPNGQFWLPARIYDTDGSLGGWNSKAFAVNQRIVGICHGTYTVGSES